MCQLSRFCWIRSKIDILIIMIRLLNWIQCYAQSKSGKRQPSVEPVCNDVDFRSDKGSTNIHKIESYCDYKLLDREALYSITILIPVSYVLNHSIVACLDALHFRSCSLDRCFKDFLMIMCMKFKLCHTFLHGKINWIEGYSNWP